jgi:transposase
MKQFDAVRLILTSPLSDREIGVSTGLSKTTVRRYRQLAAAKRVHWSDVSELSFDVFHGVFNPLPPTSRSKRLPDMEVLHQRLQTRGVNLQLLWEEYCLEDPASALSYSHLAAKFKHYRATLPSVMRQFHPPGERAFVDYSGVRPHYVDSKTREKIPVELFVGVLGASSLMFATCTHSQKVPDFLRSHVAMLNYFGGVPHMLVPDNLKSAVTKPGRVPVLQRSYEDLARHYGAAIVPTRPYHPKDKASVEVSVKVAQQRILSQLHHKTFYSLDEINAAIAVLLEKLNERPMRKDGMSRRQRFDLLERHALNPLPALPYEYAEWTAVPKVSADYHVCVDGHFYSVPHTLVGKKLEARVTEREVELLHGRRRVALHVRNTQRGQHTTLAAHRSPAHRAQGERTPENMLAWAKGAGANILRFVEHQLSQGHPAVGLPACEAVQSLAKTHGTLSVEAAARKSLTMRSPTITTLRRVISRDAKGAPLAPEFAHPTRGALAIAQELMTC